ncbi:hypothetical protein HK405_002165, partial [Cladochytrium tenue]
MQKPGRSLSQGSFETRRQMNTNASVGSGSSNGASPSAIRQQLPPPPIPLRDGSTQIDFNHWNAQLNQMVVEHKQRQGGGPASPRANQPPKAQQSPGAAYSLEPQQVASPFGTSSSDSSATVRQPVLPAPTSVPPVPPAQLETQTRAPPKSPKLQEPAVTSPNPTTSTADGSSTTEVEGSAASVKHTFGVQFAFVPTLPDEVKLNVGDMVEVL